MVDLGPLSTVNMGYYAGPAAADDNSGSSDMWPGDAKNLHSILDRLEPGCEEYWSVLEVLGNPDLPTMKLCRRYGIPPVTRMPPPEAFTYYC